jgi:hypothetical protein
LIYSAPLVSGVTSLFRHPIKRLQQALLAKTKRDSEAFLSHPGFPNPSTIGAPYIWIRLALRFSSATPPIIFHVRFQLLPMIPSAPRILASPVSSHHQSRDIHTGSWTLSDHVGLRLASLSSSDSAHSTTSSPWGPPCFIVGLASHLHPEEGLCRPPPRGVCRLSLLSPSTRSPSRHLRPLV